MIFNKILEIGCSISNNDNLSAIYWSIRALMAEIPSNTKENLQEFFEKARKNYESVIKEKNDYCEVFLICLFICFLLNNSL